MPYTVFFVQATKVLISSLFSLFAGQIRNEMKKAHHKEYSKAKLQLIFYLIRDYNRLSLSEHRLESVVSTFAFQGLHSLHD
jgi:hypothetical protein